MDVSGDGGTAPDGVVTGLVLVSVADEVAVTDGDTGHVAAATASDADTGVVDWQVTTGERAACRPGVDAAAAATRPRSAAADHAPLL